MAGLRAWDWSLVSFAAAIDRRTATGELLWAYYTQAIDTESTHTFYTFFGSIVKNRPKRPVRMHGRTIAESRHVSFAAIAPHERGTTTDPPLPWNDRLDQLVAATMDYLPSEVPAFNSASVHYYDAKAVSAAHADHDAIGQYAASWSFGASRAFVISREGEEPTSFKLRNGSLLLIGPAMQASCKHAVPKQPDAKGPRINITLRYDPEHRKGPSGYHAVRQK